MNIRLRLFDGEIYFSLLRIKYDVFELNDEDILNSDKELFFVIIYEMDIFKIKKDIEVLLLVV